MPRVDADRPRDPLTGLHRRAALERDLARLVSSRRAGFLALFDIDGFIYVNDAYGHHVGDQLLCRFARHIERCTARRCTAYRITSDGFAVLGAGVGAARAECIGQAVVRSLGLSFDGEWADRRITVSAGLAVWPRGEPGWVEPRHLLAEADRAVYLAKRDGGGRVRRVVSDGWADRPDVEDRPGRRTRSGRGGGHGR